MKEFPHRWLRALDGTILVAKFLLTMIAASLVGFLLGVIALAVLRAVVFAAWVILASAPTERYPHQTFADGTCRVESPPGEAVTPWRDPCSPPLRLSPSRH